MVDTTIDNGGYKPTNITGGHHPVGLMWKPWNISENFHQIWSSSEAVGLPARVAVLRVLRQLGVAWPTSKGEPVLVLISIQKHDENGIFAEEPGTYYIICVYI